jgi:hypothetical protein
MKNSDGTWLVCVPGSHLSSCFEEVLTEIDFLDMGLILIGHGNLLDSVSFLGRCTLTQPDE